MLKNQTPFFRKLKINDTAILIFILCVSAIIRFWNYTEIPYMHDELSALSRTDFSNLSDLILKGARVDGHPVGVQIFLYYWTKLFSFNEMVVKLPFIISGIFSILITYKLTKLWFNSSVALVVISFMSSIQYLVMYSQIARPYMFGMFFVLMMVWCWSNYFFDSIDDVKDEDKKPNKTKWLIAYVLFSVACAYTHHLALLFAVIVGLTGILFITKNTWKGYLLSGISIFVLYLPHLEIFVFQFSKGGLGGENGWLQKPGKDWLFNYLKYIFHFSCWMYFLVAILIVISLIFRSKDIKKQQKYRIISISWFLSFFLIQYLYSVYVSAVIQYSTLIFAFPFLLIFLFSLLGELKMKGKIGIVVSILTVSISTLVVERNHLHVFYKQPYEQQVLNTYQALDQIKTPKNATVLLMIPPYYKEFYFKKYNRTFESIFYDPFNEKPDTRVFSNFVDTLSTTYFIAGNLPLSYIQIIKSKYPYQLSSDEGFSYNTFCFSKTKPKKETKKSAIFSKKYNLNSLDSLTEYGEILVIPLKDVLKSRHTILNLTADAFCEDSTSNPLLVVDISANNESILWLGASYKDFVVAGRKFNKIFLSHDFNSFDLKKYPDAELHIYIWNPTKKAVQLGNLQVETMPGNPVIYGLYEPLD